MTQKKMAIIGECMIELTARNNDFSRGFGGDTLNTAVYVAREADATCLSVEYVTALGVDSFSETMLLAWQQEGVQTSLVQRLENKLPGLYVIETDTQGERSFCYWRSDAAARYWLETDRAAMICQQLAHFDYLYLSGISLAILPAESREKLMSLLQRCRQNGGKIIFDNNYRPRVWSSPAQAQTAWRAMLQLTDVAFLTLDDETLLWGEAGVETVVARTHVLGVTEVIIKRGAESCLVSLAGQPPLEVPAIVLPPEYVVDTTAAGDAFSAGYLAVRLCGGSARDAARHGHLIAGTVIQHRGAIIPRDAMPKK